jgi:GTP 3',8-cyclase
LSPEELVEITSGLEELGVRQIRLTGGEPLARREFREIAEGIGRLPIEKFGLTTNGYWLEGELPFLAEIGCRHINVSLDSLQADNFESITRTPFFERVVASILKAKEMGFPVKINCVLIRGANETEVEDYVRFSARHDIPVRFLEYMKIGPDRHRHDETFISAGEVIERLEEHWSLTPIHADQDATAFSYRTDDGAEIGFIASESRPFCQHCSRLRLSSRGMLRACLMKEDGINLTGVPRERYPDILDQVMAMKPTGRIEEIAQPMFEIGG